MVLPLMLTLYLGTAEVSQGVGIDRKVTLTTRTAADLAAQVSEHQHLRHDQPARGLVGGHRALRSDEAQGHGVAGVDRCQQQRHGELELYAQRHQAGGRIRRSRCPRRSSTPSTALIFSEVSYTYKPTIGYVITGTLNLSDQIYMRPRLSDSITGPSSC